MARIKATGLTLPSADRVANNSIGSARETTVASSVVNGASAQQKA
jgi:hypothetical protein